MLGFSARFVQFHSGIFNDDDVTFIYKILHIVSVFVYVKWLLYCWPAAIHFGRCVQSFVFQFTAQFYSHSVNVHSFKNEYIQLQRIACAHCYRFHCHRFRLSSLPLPLLLSMMLAATILPLHKYYHKLCYLIIPTVTCNHFEVLKPSH